MTLPAHLVWVIMVMLFIYRLYYKKKNFFRDGLSYSQSCSQDSEVVQAHGLHNAEVSIDRWIVLIIPQEGRKKNSAFIFQFPGWALVAPSYFTLLAILA